MTEKYYFDPIDCSFYRDSMREVYEAADGWPDTLIAITASRYNKLMAGQEAGQMIVEGKDGKPSLVTPVATPEEMINGASVRKVMLLEVAAARIAPLQDAADLEIATGEEAALLKEWKTYRVLLNRVDVTTAPDISWPEAPGNVA